MKLEDIEELRVALISREQEEIGDMEVDDLQQELLTTLKQKEALELSKKTYGKRCSDTLKLVKAHLNRITQILDEIRI